MKNRAVGVNRLVRSYCSEGLPRRWYSQESAAALARRKAVIAVRDRKGEILSIHFYGEARVALKNRLKAGTRYSYQESVGEGQRRWNHSRLEAPEDRKLDRFASLPKAQFLRVYAALQSQPFRAVVESISQPFNPKRSRTKSPARKAAA